MHLGGSWTDDPVTVQSQDQANEVLNFLIANDVVAFDHADIYCKGKSEIVFGNFLENSGLDRTSLFIQSKCGIQLGVGALGSSHYSFDKNYIISQTLQSIKNLKCQYLDALLLHRPDPLWQADQVAEAFIWFKEQGLVRQFGVSNMSPFMIEQLKTHYPDIKFNQLQFSLHHSHLLKQEVFYNTENQMMVDTGFLPYHNKNNITIQAWGPLDQGKFLSEEVKYPGVQLQLEELSKKYQATKEAILLSWVRKLPYDIVPILGSTKIDRIKASLDYDKIELDRHDWYNLWIEALGTRIP
jgi:predicted oxidoreductase